MAIGDLIRILRERQGWTQEQLGEFTGYDQCTISRIERGLLEPTSEFLNIVTGLIPNDEVLPAYICGEKIALRTRWMYEQGMKQRQVIYA